MVTVAWATLLVPPGPVQDNEYVVLAVKVPVGYVPLMPFVPFHPATPEPVHAVALVELHDSVEALPLGIAEGLAVRIAVGMMLTVALFTALVPPGPVQVSEKIADVDSVPVLCVPLVAFVPLHPPVAVHEVALVELQVSVEALPAATAVGFAVKVVVGVMLTVAVAAVLVPPAPVQVSE
jgi:hypothetical protein